MSTYLPLDSNNNPIPALRFKKNGAHQIEVSASSVRNSSAFDKDTRVISIFATEDVFVRFGDSNVIANTSDHFFPAGVYYDIALGDGPAAHYTHLAVLRVSGNGTLYISEKE